MISPHKYGRGIILWLGFYSNTIFALLIRLVSLVRRLLIIICHLNWNIQRR
jgi:hypothetical protein